LHAIEVKDEFQVFFTLVEVRGQLHVLVALSPVEEMLASGQLHASICFTRGERAPGVH